MAPQAQDNADLAAIQKAGAIRIGTEGTYAPFSFHDASGKLVGFDVDLGRAVAAKLGVKADFVEGRWDGLIAGLDAKRYDVVINQVGINPGAPSSLIFPSPTSARPQCWLCAPTTRRSARGTEGQKSANTITSNFGKLAKANGAEVPVQGFNEAIDLLPSRRVEATVNDKLSPDFPNSTSRTRPSRLRRKPPARRSNRRACCCARSAGIARGHQQGAGRHQGRRHLQSDF